MRLNIYMNSRQTKIINRLINKTNEKVTSFEFKTELKKQVFEIMQLFRQIPSYDYLTDGSELVDQLYQEFNGIEEIR